MALFMGNNSQSFENMSELIKIKKPAAGGCGF
jgi:hypothetical protein